jgi:hypothetical protein
LVVTVTVSVLIHPESDKCFAMHVVFVRLPQLIPSFPSPGKKI